MIKLLSILVTAKFDHRGYWLPDSSMMYNLAGRNIYTVTQIKCTPHTSVIIFMAESREAQVWKMSLLAVNGYHWIFSLGVGPLRLRKVREHRSEKKLKIFKSAFIAIYTTQHTTYPICSNEILKETDIQPAYKMARSGMYSEGLSENTWLRICLGSFGYSWDVGIS